MPAWKHATAVRSVRRRRPKPRRPAHSDTVAGTARPARAARGGRPSCGSAHETRSDRLIERLEEAGRADEGHLTIAGALYLLDEPASDLGNAFVEVLRYRDDESDDYDRRDEIGGPLHHQLRESVERVMDELGTELAVVGVRRYELPPLPEVVVRVGVANALAHRSYEINRTLCGLRSDPASYGSYPRVGPRARDCAELA